MPDEETVWKIKDGEYPHIDGLKEAKPATMQDIFGENHNKWMWTITEGTNTYPVIKPVSEPITPTIPNIFKKPYPTWMWRVKDGRTYPYLFPLTEPVIYSKIKQRPYITVHEYNTEQSGFDSNGIAILAPTRCEITHELNGAYELVLEYPLRGGAGSNSGIEEYNYIKADGQIFRIYRCVTTWRNNTGTLVAYARHIFYTMSDWWCDSGFTVKRITCQDALNNILTQSNKGRDYIEGYIQPFSFSAGSDIKDMLPDADYSEMSVVDAIMGTNGNSILSAYGGELYRDNFKFSINKELEGCKHNAFVLQVGLDLTGVQRDIDYSSFCTVLRVNSEYGDTLDIYYPTGVSFIKRDIVRSVTLKYNEDEYSYEQFIKDANEYGQSVMKPHVKYTINVVALQNNPNYDDFEGLQEIRLGDYGTVKDSRLGILFEIRVTKLVKNVITGEISSLVFETGSLDKTTAGSRFKVTTKADREQTERDIEIEVKNFISWDSLANYTWNGMRKFTWYDANGREKTSKE